MTRDELLAEVMASEAGRDLLYTMVTNAPTIGFALQGEAFVMNRNKMDDDAARLMELSRRINDLFNDAKEAAADNKKPAQRG